MRIKTNQKGSIMEWLVVLLIVGVIMLSLIVSPLIAYNTDEYVNFTVKNKERITSGSGSSMTSKYLIYTDNGVYENTDSFWYWKWDSADVYNSIDIGKTCKAKVYGFRVPFMSWFRNILTIDCK